MNFIRKIFGLNDTGPSLKELNAAENNAEERMRRSASFLIESTAEQSDAVHETMASLTEIRSMLAQTEQQVERSQHVTEQTKERSQERLKTVERLQTAMDAIKDSNQLLGDLQASFQIIKSKARVINEIVAKTQILSFNASIEAARAGQFGKGFSVVAEEVGRLAKTSGSAAKEIESLLNESQLRAISVVKMVVARADEGVVVTRDVKESFAELIKSVNEISVALTAMSHASREQTLGIERTTSSLEKISGIAEKIKRNAEEMLEFSSPSMSSGGAPLGLDIEGLIENIESQPKPALTLVAKNPDRLKADDPSFRPQE